MPAGNFESGVVRSRARENFSVQVRFLGRLSLLVEPVCLASCEVSAQGLLWHVRDNSSKAERVANAKLQSSCRERDTRGAPSERGPEGGSHPSVGNMNYNNIDDPSAPTIELHFNTRGCKDCRWHMGTHRISNGLWSTQVQGETILPCSDEGFRKFQGQIGTSQGTSAGQSARAIKTDLVLPRKAPSSLSL